VPEHQIRVAAVHAIRQAARMKVWIRVLAVALAVIGHGFLLAIGTAQNIPLGFAYLGSVMCLWVAAGLLWRRTMD
jgi:hypothetical protein